ncbi:hypothetical protein FW320_06365 [Azospirillum sp. Vi22]|uniref:hypothetical protein n=1 Tax=Azospirillum baldaniorum TaxID=1064539 RepID=UPI00157B128F|nr:hypothetical protein [Azospirillum baldaniorum]NUB05799.1 hypothetical protein [Azospirillum baldaniorum]
MPDPSSAADGGVLSNIYSQVAAGVGGSLVAWRLLVSFGRQDRAAKMEAEIRADLRQRLDKAMTDIASMAHERNQAVMVKLQLETELRLSKEHLNSARTERDEARTALVRVQQEVENLMATNQRLVEDAAVAEAEARGAPAGAKPGSRQVPGERPWQK